MDKHRVVAGPHMKPVWLGFTCCHPVCCRGSSSLLLLVLGVAATWSSSSACLLTLSLSQLFKKTGTRSESLVLWMRLLCRAWVVERCMSPDHCVACSVLLSGPYLLLVRRMGICSTSLGKSRVLILTRCFNACYHNLLLVLIPIVCSCPSDSSLWRQWCWTRWCFDFNDVVVVVVVVVLLLLLW